VAQHGEEVVPIEQDLVGSFSLDEQSRICVLPLDDKEVGESHLTPHTVGAKRRIRHCPLIFDRSILPQARVSNILGHFPGSLLVLASAGSGEHCLRSIACRL
jgi:hypothetical protein